MADNVAITPGTGATVAADDIAGVHYQRIKQTWGPDGTANDTDVATGKPLPIQVRSATGLIPIGEPTDAKSTATDTTSATGISIWKQISASVQLFVFGAGTAAAAARVTLASDGPFATLSGAVTETAPATDTASSGLNGRLQRLAQRITSLITQVDLVTSAINTGVATALPAGTNNIGDVDVLTVPADPFGVNADAASATGSISAKLRFIAATGIPVTGTVTVGSHAVTNAGTFATQSTLQAGTAAFGKLAANSGVDIGDVDVTSLPALATGTNNIGHVGGVEYELVAASQSTQAIGATGATGDYLSHVLIVPETTAAGTVAIKDGAGTAINIFVAGTLSNLVPFTVGIGAKSAAGAWQITTGANVHCIAFGDFT